MAKAPTEIRTITMLDGRTVDFPGKRRLQKTSAVLADGALQVRLDFENGESRVLNLLPALIPTFALHGAEQKLGDEISSIDDIDDAVEAIDQLMGRLNAGDWTKERVGGASGMAGASILARALVEVTGQPIAIVRDYLGNLDGKTKAALRLSGEVAPVVKKLEDEKAARSAARGKTAPAVDVSGALAALRAGPTPVTSAFPPASAEPEVAAEPAEAEASAEVAPKGKKKAA